MYFGDLAKLIGLWMGSLATAYTFVFFNAVNRGHGIGPAAAKVVLLSLALAALLVIIRHSKTQWGVVFGSLLVVVAASHMARRHQAEQEPAPQSYAVVHQAEF